MTNAATTKFIRLTIAYSLILCCCSRPLPGGPPDPEETIFRQAQDGSETCVSTVVSMPLLGVPGDSPVVPVQVHGQQAAMFFSPGFAPLLFRDNGPIVFPRYRRVDLRQQDGDVLSAYATVAPALSVGDLSPAVRRGYLLPDPDDRKVGGRPVVGMLGRDILPEGAVVALDLPGHRITISSMRRGCANALGTPLAGSTAMQQEVLSITVRIDGHPVQAVLEPDLPVSILPTALAGRVGISDTELAKDSSVVTKFGRGMLGRRHHVALLELGDVKLRHVTFDVEEGVQYAMLGLNVFALGVGTFDFRNGRFLFRKMISTLPDTTDLHFNQTKVAHVMVMQ